MESSKIPAWGRKIAALAQIGLEYSPTPYDTERYEELRCIAAEMLAQGDEAKEKWVLDLFQRETGYATPKVDVRAIVFREGRILLVREHSDGRWTPPGGWADIGEPPSICAEREALEESGFEVKAKKLLAVYDRALHGNVPEFPFHVYKMFFLCDLTGGEARTSHETDEVAFFERHALPELSLGRITPKQIDRLFALVADPSAPTDFD